ncbi:hypothetical protein HK103_002059 [Boothiomyces macroporosus]|uniref:Uncharacterized protein n=1 Tax=Boothiomyces macroporosus TaxID=261099 RepID=A0AAD5Y4Y2_9FUNG|nr:hypothetical protein HK103_002059 [Boothiomyces macroporosus]
MNSLSFISLKQALLGFKFQIVRLAPAIYSSLKGNIPAAKNVQVEVDFDTNCSEFIDMLNYGRITTITFNHIFAGQVFNKVSKFQNVNKLQFSGCSFGSYKILCQVLVKYDIKELEIYKNLDYQCAVMQEIFSTIHMTKLERATFKNCFINDQCVIYFARNLPCSGVSYLDLSFNQISDIGATALAGVLNSSQLKSLNLKGNQIGKLGLINISKALSCSKIQCVEIDTNRFDSDDWCILYNIIPKCKLKKLSARIYGEKSVLAFQQSLPQTDITELELDLYLEYLEAVLMAVSKSKVLKLSFLGYQPIHGKTLPLLLHSLPANELILKNSNLGENISLLLSNIKNSQIKHLRIRDTTIKHQDLSKVMLGGLDTLTFGLCEFQSSFLDKLAPIIIHSNIRKLIFEADLFSKEAILKFVGEIALSMLRVLKIGLEGNEKTQLRKEIKSMLANSSINVII